MYMMKVAILFLILASEAMMTVLELVNTFKTILLSLLTNIELKKNSLLRESNEEKFH